MSVHVVREPPSTLAAYARVPIAFVASSILETSQNADGSFMLSERRHAHRVKNYDELPGEGPESWPRRFDISGWTFFAAYLDDERVGGAAVVIRSSEVEMLDRRDDLALLWDIRVAPAVRGQGVGSALMHAAESFAAASGCVELKVETQDINVPACRFYQRHGFGLRAAVPGAYPEFPEETMLLWYKRLSDVPRPSRAGFDRA